MEIEAPLNDRPLTYISNDISDPEPLTPAHLLHGRRLTRLPHDQTTLEELQDPTYCSAGQVRRDAKIQSILLQHFASRWRHEYLTSLREFYHPTGRGGQEIKVEDIVMVHDNGPQINWKMAVLESLTTGMDGLVCSANVRTKNGVNNGPVMKLFPLKVCDASIIQMENNEVDQEDHNTAEARKSLDNPMTGKRPQRSAAQRARKRLVEWIQIIHAPPPPPWRMSMIARTLTHVIIFRKLTRVIVFTYIEGGCWGVCRILK